LHYTRIGRSTPGWGFSLVTLIAFAIALIAGFLPAIVMWFISPTPEGQETLNQVQGLWLGFMPLKSGVTEGSPLFWIFLNVISPFMSTMFSLLGFFIASAAFRAFRARSLEATLLLLAAVIIMLGQTPIGGMLWERIPEVMIWIFNVPNTAAKRAILFGITMGSIAFSLRIIFGIERAYLGGRD
jgi:hypothetical protein